MKKVSLVLSILVVLGMASPAQAHHKRSVAALKSQINTLQVEVNSLKSRLFTAESKIKYMDSDGFYSGPVEEFQVVSFTCQQFDDAIWLQDPDFNFRFLHCSGGPYGSRRARGIQKFLR